MDQPTIDTAATAFMLIAASMVLLMTPGLALFYGGMARARSVVNMMMMSFGVMGVVGVAYVLWGYSMSFGSQSWGGVVSNPFEKFGMRGVVGDPAPGTTVDPDGVAIVDVFGADVWIPEVLYAGFQMTFAILTVALISGAIACRVRFSRWMLFAALWVTVAYFPIAHMVWGGGLLSGSADGISAMMFGAIDGVANVVPIDFAGGTVVHINAGIAALVLAVIVGKRRGFGSSVMRPHNVPLVMLGAGLLWFGWFGFNAGSELAADGLAGLVWLNTVAATSAAILGWLVIEKLRDGRNTAVGAASGVVAGLVAITPACGSVSPVGAMVIGVIAGGLSAYAVGWKERIGYDDSLDVVGVHLVAGLWGTLSAGLLATETGLLYGGGLRQLVVQIVIASISLAYAALVTAILAYAIKATIGWRISDDIEELGIDLGEHAGIGYDLEHRVEPAISAPGATSSADSTSSYAGSRRG